MQCAGCLQRLTDAIIERLKVFVVDVIESRIRGDDDLVAVRREIGEELSDTFSDSCLGWRAFSGVTLNPRETAVASDRLPEMMQGIERRSVCNAV
jgi:hypothetical protein